MLDSILRDEVLEGGIEGDSIVDDTNSVITTVASDDNTLVGGIEVIQTLDGSDPVIRIDVSDGRTDDNDDGVNGSSLSLIGFPVSVVEAVTDSELTVGEIVVVVVSKEEVTSGDGLVDNRRLLIDELSTVDSKTFVEELISTR